MLDNSTWHAATMSDAELRVLVSKNAEALKVARAGLNRPCQVPVDCSRASGVYINTNLLRLSGLAQAVAAEAHVLELEDRRADAAEAYLTAIRLGGAVGHGGLLADALTGNKIEATGTASLEKLVSGLDAKPCRQALTVIESGTRPLGPTWHFRESRRSPPASLSSSLPAPRSLLLSMPFAGQTDHHYG